MNTKLSDFYKSQTDFWSDWEKAKETEDLSAPLLLKVPDNYEQALLKIMFVGCETNGWEGDSNNIPALMSEYQTACKQMLWTYQEFKNSSDAKAYDERLKKYIRKAFWEWAREIKNKLGSETTQIVWNNLLKVGKKEGKGAISQISLDLLKGHFKEFFLKEIEILQPDVLIFVCGKDAVYLEQITFLDINLSPLKTIKHSESRSVYLNKGSFLINEKEILVLHSCHPSIQTKGKGSKIVTTQPILEKT